MDDTKLEGSTPTPEPSSSVITNTTAEAPVQHPFSPELTPTAPVETSVPGITFTDTTPAPESQSQPVSAPIETSVPGVTFTPTAPETPAGTSETQPVAPATKPMSELLAGVQQVQATPNLVDHDAPTERIPVPVNPPVAETQPEATTAEIPAPFVAEQAPLATPTPEPIPSAPEPTPVVQPAEPVTPEYINPTPFVAQPENPTPNPVVSTPEPAPAPSSEGIMGKIKGLLGRNS